VTLGDWAGAAAIVSGVIVAVLPALKTRSESRKLGADAAAVLGTSAGAIVSSVKDEMAQLRADVREMRAWRDQLQVRLRKHARWDDQMVTAARAAGMDVPDPPMLFDDDEGATVR
jgi:hypothetical protein